MNILILLVLIPLSSVFAGNQEVISLDLNKDGKIDFVEVFENKKLIERKEDLNFDGIFDRQTLFLPPTEEFYKIVNEKLPGEKGRTRISYWNDKKLKKTFSLVQMDLNDDGKWDREFQRSSELNQHKDDCEEPTQINNLLNSGLQIANQSQPFTTNSLGQQIHQSCFDQSNREWFLNISEKATSIGLSCLEKLGQKGGRGAMSNRASLQNLLNQKNVQFICNETDYDWGSSVMAHATTSETKPEDKLKHPGVSVNPAYVKSSFQNGKQGEKDLMNTLFHEQLHNLGYKHGHDVEYPYACGTCCLPDDGVSDEVKAAACQVCSGNYTGPLDLAYLKDITKLASKTYDRRQSLGTTINYLKANPGDINGLIYLSNNSTGVFDPVGPLLAEKILSNHTINIEDQLELEINQSYKDSNAFKPYMESSKIIADAYYASYHQQNPSEALRILRDNAKIISKQLVKGADEDSQYIVSTMRDHIKTIVYDVWLNKHSGNLSDESSKNRMNMEAYDLHKLYKF